jgi:hypothetical protein
MFLPNKANFEAARSTTRCARISQGRVVPCGGREGKKGFPRERNRRLRSLGMAAAHRTLGEQGRRQAKNGGAPRKYILPNKAKFRVPREERDPAVQFSSGGQTVSFMIPAGQTQAFFSNGLTHVQLQTGTIAGTITLTPDFLTAAGIDVTPASPQTLTVTVPSQAPALLTAQVSSSSGDIVHDCGYRVLDDAFALGA